VPRIAYLGDTAIGPVFDHPDVQNAEILITECTFFDREHKTKAKAGRHLHVDQFIEIVPKLKNQHLILTHVSRRTGIPRAKRILRKLLGEQRMQNIHFMMDFEGATSGGEVEDLAPPPPDTAE
jgi:ribonuclease Z